MWFKKKSQISGYNPNTAYDGTDWRTTGKNSPLWSVPSTLPSAAAAGNYFYLPTLGYYISGHQAGVGYGVGYWSSSSDPRYSSDAYYLFFNIANVYVKGTGRYNGCRVGGFE